jgi:hypothetical protein
MAQWDKSDFEAEAAKIASAYRAGVHQNGSSINALAAKVAREHNLTEEQIKRLVRATNVSMFDQEYGALKKAGAPDRIVEFDTGDPDVVIRELYKNATLPTEKVAAAARYPDLSDQLASYRGRPTLPAPKTASVAEDLAAIERALGKEPPLERQILHLQKVADELAVRIKTAELIWNTTMHAIGSGQRHLYFNRDAFEKNALALYGGDVLPELNALRTDRKLPALTIPNEKLAMLHDRLVGEPTKEAELLHQAAKAREEFFNLKAGREEALKKLAGLRKALPRA